MSRRLTVAEPFFSTPRLEARRFSVDDLDDLVAVRSDPEVARFQDWVAFDGDAARALIAANATGEPGQPGWFQFALRLKADGRLAGDCGLRIFESDHRLAQIGYTIARPLWNRGYAGEAVRGLVGYAFGRFPIHRMIATVDPRNEASIRVLERSGFIKEAHLRQSEWFKGAWADDAVFALLDSDVRGGGR